MKYNDLIELGFKREDYSDNVHFREFGFQAFHVSRKLGRRHEMFWDIIDRDSVVLYRYEKDGCTIAKRWEIEDLDTVRQLVEMFG